MSCNPLPAQAAGRMGRNAFVHPAGPLGDASSNYDLTFLPLCDMIATFLGTERHMARPSLELRLTDAMHNGGCAALARALAFSFYYFYGRVGRLPHAG
jgi:hypothetical protein